MPWHPESPCECFIILGGRIYQIVLLKLRYACIEVAVHIWLAADEGTAVRWAGGGGGSCGSDADCQRCTHVVQRSSLGHAVVFSGPKPLPHLWAERVAAALHLLQRKRKG
jgi:hypothetical protein